MKKNLLLALGLLPTLLAHSQSWRTQADSLIINHVFADKVSHVVANIAFAGIPLESITLHAEIPPSLHYSFINVPKEIPVYIPCNTLDLYQTAEGWDDFTNFIEDCSLSTSEHIEKEVRVLCYPNPTQNQLHLHYPPGVQPTKVELYDLLGHLAYEQHNDLEIIDMQQLPAGKYLLKIMLQDGLIYTNKIVKE